MLYEFSDLLVNFLHLQHLERIPIKAITIDMD